MTKHKCRKIKGGPCGIYCNPERVLEVVHFEKWAEVDCESCKAEGLRLGHYQPGNAKAREGK